MDIKAEVAQFFVEWDNERLTEFEVGYHTAMFLQSHFDRTKLHPAWGFTPELALEAQLHEYCREVFEWSDPREGEDA